MGPDFASDDLYRVLGVADTVSAAELKTAWRAAARAAHPDLGGSPDRFARVQEAWRVLGDADARAEYDRVRRLDAARPAPDPTRPGPAGPGAGDRGGVDEPVDAVVVDDPDDPVWVPPPGPAAGPSPAAGPVWSPPRAPQAARPAGPRRRLTVRFGRLQVTVPLLRLGELDVAVAVVAGFAAVAAVWFALSPTGPLPPGWVFAGAELWWDWSATVTSTPVLTVACVAAAVVAAAAAVLRRRSPWWRVVLYPAAVAACAAVGPFVGLAAANAVLWVVFALMVLFVGSVILGALTRTPDPPAR